MQPKKNESADCTTNQWYLLEFQKDLTLLSFRYASVPEQQAYLTCQTLWPSLGQQFGCGRAQPAADRQAWCLKSKGRAAAQQMGSLLWMTAIHFPLEHHGHMSAASYSAQCSTVSQCVFWYSSAWQRGVGVEITCDMTLRTERSSTGDKEFVHTRDIWFDSLWSHGAIKAAIFGFHLEKMWFHVIWQAVSRAALAKRKSSILSFFLYPLPSPCSCS